MPSWMYFVLALAGLLGGYFVYGSIVEKVFGPNPNRPTPACKMPDGVDYVEMSPAKVFLIQLLNIAGLGPVFGPILGALYGPIALVWVVIGCVFAGAVHDYFSGMLSVRDNGKSVPACFMTAVSAVYICFEKSMGFGMSYEMSNIVGIAIALVCFALLLTVGRKIQPSDDLSV